MTFKGLWAEFKEFAFKGNMIELAVAVIIGGAFGGVINSLVQDIIMPTVSYAVTAANTTATDAELVAKRAEADLERKKQLAAAQAGPATQAGGGASANSAVASANATPDGTDAAGQRLADAIKAGVRRATTQPGGASANPVVIVVPMAGTPAAIPPAPPPTPATSSTNVNAVNITWTIGRIRIGNFLGQLLNFLIVAFAVFITIIKLIGGVMKKVSHPHASAPTMKDCPFCCSTIPFKAIKCGHCTADLPKN